MIAFCTSYTDVSYDPKTWGRIRMDPRGGAQTQCWFLIRSIYFREQPGDKYSQTFRFNGLSDYSSALFYILFMLHVWHIVSFTSEFNSKHSMVARPSLSWTPVMPSKDESVLLLVCSATEGVRLSKKRYSGLFSDSFWKSHPQERESEPS